ncbi:glutathione S-transferase family protein [Kiloniella antarctica]|uniref:Glutathione S-transferase family protein n=1 Tax=Kiloniella antarctica TaxID=1550907 RepID=A0ABW5BFH7_9PROT
MIFYTVPVSNYCAKVELALALKGIEAIHQIPPGGYGSENYKVIVPTGTVPALIDEGLVLSDSETINEYLEEKFPKPALLPITIGDRATTRMLSRFHDLKFEPLIRALFKHMSPSQRQEAVIKEKYQELDQQLSLLERMGHFSPYIAGDQISLADCGFAPTILLATKMFKAVNMPLTLSQKIESWQMKMSEHPIAEPILSKYAMAVDDWLQIKLSS